VRTFDSVVPRVVAQEAMSTTMQHPRSAARSFIQGR